MKQQARRKGVITAVVTVALTAGSAGAALAQAHPEASWERQADRATQALNMLEDQGFTQFSHFRASGQDFTADVIRHGQTEQVSINPDTNQILQTGSTVM